MVDLSGSDSLPDDVGHELCELFALEQGAPLGLGEFDGLVLSHLVHLGAPVFNNKCWHMSKTAARPDIEQRNRYARSTERTTQSASTRPSAPPQPASKEMINPPCFVCARANLEAHIELLALEVVVRDGLASEARNLVRFTARNALGSGNQQENAALTCRATRMSALLSKHNKG